MKIYLPLSAVRRLIVLVAGLTTAAGYAQVEPRSLTPAKALHQPGLNYANAGVEAWIVASEISGFKQREPFEGREATEKTSVRTQGEV